MFLTAEAGPVTSGRDAVATEATRSYCIDLRTAVDDLWKHKQAEIKRRCAPSMPQGLIDAQEVFGFALADGLGRPLLPHDAARGVGQAGDNAVAAAMGCGKAERRRKGRVEKTREAAREAVRVAKAAAAKDPSLLQRISAAEAAGEAAVAAVFAARVDLKLPNATVGALKPSGSVLPLRSLKLRCPPSPPSQRRRSPSCAARWWRRSPQQQRRRRRRMLMRLVSSVHSGGLMRSARWRRSPQLARGRRSRPSES